MAIPKILVVDDDVALNNSTRFPPSHALEEPLQAPAAADPDLTSVLQVQSRVERVARLDLSRVGSRLDAMFTIHSISLML